MFNCERCGAVLPPNTDQCAYCGTVSGPARALLQAEAARAAQAAAQSFAQAAVLRRMAQHDTERAASRALLWGLVGPIFFCLPFPPVLALLAYNRATRIAREGGVAVPTRAKVGLALAALCALGFVVFCIVAVFADHAANVRIAARKAELAKIITARGTSPTLDHDFACALAETSLLTDGFNGSTNSGIFNDLQCIGAVRVVKDRAELDDFKLRTSSSSAPVTATICFKHGSSWFVERTGITSCELEH